MVAGDGFGHRLLSTCESRRICEVGEPGFCHFLDEEPGEDGSFEDEGEVVLTSDRASVLSDGEGVEECIGFVHPVFEEFFVFGEEDDVLPEISLSIDAVSSVTGTLLRLATHNFVVLSLKR